MNGTLLKALIEEKYKDRYSLGCHITAQWLTRITTDFYDSTNIEIWCEDPQIKNLDFTEEITAALTRLFGREMCRQKELENLYDTS